VFSLVRRFIKTAVGFLAAGLAIGAWMIIQRDLLGGAPSEYLRSAHAHALLAGFGMMMIMGVALWLFPRPARDDTRYRPGLVAIAYWLATLGTAGRVGGEVLHLWTRSPWLGWTIVVAGLAQMAGMLLFFWAMWPRIRPVGSALREKEGERF
jgi:heme/copper-type cytochrome/quinol oxidase subunit 1